MKHLALYYAHVNIELLIFSYKCMGRAGPGWYGTSKFMIMIINNYSYVMCTKLISPH